MNRIVLAFIVLGLAAPPALATSLYVIPDAPTTLGGATYLPWNVVRYDSGAYSLGPALPAGTAIDGLHRMAGGDWLFSVEAPADLGGVTFQPGDVIRYDGTNYGYFLCGSAVGVPFGSDIDAVSMEGGDHGRLVVSFDVPTTIGANTFEPHHLVRFRRPGAGTTCTDWVFDSLVITPSAEPANATAAASRGGSPVLSFDIPLTSGVATFLPGSLLTVSGGAYTLFENLTGWPQSSFVNALSFLPDPGNVPTTMSVQRLTLNGSLLRLIWQSSCSAGAENYGIYEGALGTWYSHMSVDCSDGFHDLTEDIGTTSGNRYYLVVATNPNDEGSYGTRSNGVERPRGTSPCVATQSISTCP